MHMEQLKVDNHKAVAPIIPAQKPCPQPLQHPAPPPAASSTLSPHLPRQQQETLNRHPYQIQHCQSEPQLVDPAAPSERHHRTFARSVFRSVHSLRHRSPLAAKVPTSLEPKDAYLSETGGTTSTSNHRSLPAATSVTSLSSGCRRHLPVHDAPPPAGSSSYGRFQAGGAWHR